MIMRSNLVFLAMGGIVATLSACEPPVPSSAPRGVGFDTPEAYARQREAQLRGAPQVIAPPPGPDPVLVSDAGPAPAPSVVGTAAPAQVAATPLAPAGEAERLAAETRAALGQPVADPAATPATLGAPVETAAAPTTAPVALDRDNPDISSEQDFGAVTGERSIAQDAARLESARSQYQVVTPSELVRPDDGGPSIIAYAQGQARPKGAAGSFGRNPFASERRSQLACRGYRSDDVAQEAFLAAGGPGRDRYNLDPDGDGNACGWDPALYRDLVGGQG